MSPFPKLSKARITTLNYYLHDDEFGLEKGRLVSWS